MENNAETLTDERRLSEVAAILAAGLVRLRERKKQSKNEITRKIYPPLPSCITDRCINRHHVFHLAIRAAAHPHDRDCHRPRALPPVISGAKPGHEVEYPLAVAILGELTASTILNLFFLPAPYLRYGRRGDAEKQSI